MQLVRNSVARGLREVDSVQAINGTGEEGARRHTNPLQVLWQRRWIVLGSMLAGVVAAFIYMQMATPIYTSSARIYIEQNIPQILSERVMSSQGSRAQTQTELIRSTPILAAAADRLDPQKMRCFRGVDNPVGMLRSMIKTGVEKSGDIVEVFADCPYPDEAAQVVNATVDAFVAFTAKQKQNSSAEVMNVLTREKAQRDVELEAKTNAMLDFKQANGTLAFESEKGKGGNIIMDRLATLQESLTKVEMDAMDAQATYEAATSLMDEPEKLRRLLDAQSRGGLVIQAGGRDDALRGELDITEMTLAKTDATYAPNHPMRAGLQQSIDGLRRKIAHRDMEFAAAAVSTLEQTWRIAERKAKALRAAFEVQQKSAFDLNGKAARYAKLDADYRRLERLCDILDSRIKELKITEDAGLISVSVLEVAKPETSPTKPQRNTVLLTGLLLGLIAGCSSVLLLDSMDERLRTAEEIRAALDLPVLGVVPHIIAKGGQCAGQLVRLEPGSDIAEAFRTIRTAVLFGIPAGRAKSILITSPSPGDGKTTLAANLAIAMAQAGQKVLLIDADFRKPRQHVIFDLQSGEAGLTTLLAGRIELKSALFQTATEGLTVLPCGAIPPNPAELLQGQPFADFLVQIAPQYNQVIIDSTPVMPVTDARILGAQCDVTILVLRAEKSTRRAAEHAREGLSSVGSRLLGVVVNDTPRKRAGYGYSYNYGYGYGGYGGHSHRVQGEGESPRTLAGNTAVEEA